MNNALYGFTGEKTVIIPNLGGLVEHINTLTGRRFVVQARYRGGEQGALRLADERGVRAVLKFGGGGVERIQAACAIVERLRAHGYPAPRYLAVGTFEGSTFSVQEALPGQPITVPSLELLEQAIALNRRQARMAGDEPRRWPEAAIRPVLFGGDGFCLHEPMQRYSPESAQLLSLVQRIVRERSTMPFPTGDIVHYDFSFANMLAEHGTITGVIDWEAASAGDCTFDLCTLLFYAAEHGHLRARLWRAVDEVSSREIAAVYLAHMMVRQVDWSIRFHTAADVARWIRVSWIVINEMNP